MDVARKYLQAGYTRVQRCARHKGGNNNRLLDELDPEKCRAAEILREKWREAAGDEDYLRLKESTGAATARGAGRISRRDTG